jgi:hypothetical protein
VKRKSEKDKEKLKKPYVRPEMKQVALRPDEAVLGNCKSSSFSGPSGSGCGVPLYCSSSGS